MLLALTCRCTRVCLFVCMCSTETKEIVRARYEFLAKDSNELSFAAGDSILLLDASNPAWWKVRSAEHSRWRRAIESARVHELRATRPLADEVPGACAAGRASWTAMSATFRQPMSSARALQRPALSQRRGTCFVCVFCLR